MTIEEEVDTWEAELALLEPLSYESNLKRFESDIYILQCCGLLEDLPEEYHGHGY